MKEIYVVQAGNSELFMLFHSAAEGLCFKKKENSVFGPYKIIAEDMADDFDAVSTGKTVYAAGQDGVGNIILVKYSSGSWTKNILFQSKTQQSYPKQFKWVLSPDPVLFYTIRHQDKTMLVKYELNASPAVIDYIDPSIPFYACADSLHNSIICYSGENGAGYRIINKEKSAASDFYKFEDRLTDIDVTAGTNGFYVLGVGRTKYGNKVVFKTIRPDGTIIKSKTFEISISIKRPLVCRAENSIWLMWATPNQVLGAKSNDNGENWSSVSRLLTLDGASALFKIRMDGAVFNCYGKDSDVKPMLITNNDVFVNPPRPREEKPRPQNPVVPNETAMQQNEMAMQQNEMAMWQQEMAMRQQGMGVRQNEPPKEVIPGSEILEFARENRDAFSDKIDKNSVSGYYDDGENSAGVSPLSYQSYNGQNPPFDIEKEKERIRQELLAAETKMKTSKLKVGPSDKIESAPQKSKPKADIQTAKKADGEEYKKIITMLEKLTEKVEKLEKKMSSKQKKIISYIEKSSFDKKSQKTFSDIMKGLETKKEKLEEQDNPK